MIRLERGVIRHERHVHISPADCAHYGVKDGERLNLREQRPDGALAPLIGERGGSRRNGRLADKRAVDRIPRLRPGIAVHGDAELPDKHVFCLDPVICPCSTMYRVHPAYVLWSLEHLAEGNVVNRITVDPATARDALVALDRMLSVP